MTKLCAFILLFYAVLLPADVVVNFADGRLRLVGREEQRKNLSSQPTTLPNGKAKGVELSWRKHCAKYAEMHISKGKISPFAKFKWLEIAMNVHVPANTQIWHLSLRFADAKGEIFQLKSKRAPLTVGEAREQQVKYTLIPGETRLTSWSGNNDKKIDWPLAFLGIACEFEAETDGGCLYFESISFKPGDARLKDITVDVETGSPVRLIIPESGNIPKVVFSNRGPEKLDFTAQLKIQDYFGNEFRQNWRASLVPGASQSVMLEHKFNTLGIWYVNYTLRLHGSNKTCSGKRSFVVMSPAGRQRLDKTVRTDFKFGVCAHPYWLPANIQALDALTASLCGIKYVRTDIVWPYVQPSEQHWRFEKFDAIVDSFARQGIEVMPILGYTPSWAVASDAKPFYTEAGRNPKFLQPDFDAYARFAAEVAKRYRGRIHYVETWNEPDGGFGNFSIKQYLELQRRGYKAIKDVNPGITVFTGGFVCLLEGTTHHYKPGLVERAIAENNYDMLAFHGHGSYEHFAPQVERLNRVRQRYRIRKPWFAGETAISSYGDAEAYQAETLFKKLLFSWANGAAGYNWYNLRNTGFDPNNSEHNFGMVTRDFYPKAVYPVYNMLASTFATAAFVERLNLGLNIDAWRFDSREAILIPSWMNAGASSALNIAYTDADSAELIDLMGNAIPVAITDKCVTFSATRQPAVLRLNNASVFEVKGRLIDYRENGLIIPGRKTTLNLTVFNPFDSPKEIILKTRSASRQLRLAPQEKRPFNLELLDEEQSSLRLECEISDSNIRGSLIVPTELGKLINSEPHSEPDFTLNSSLNVVEIYPNDPTMEHMSWKGTEDLSAKVAMFCSDDALSLSAKVTDNQHCQPYRGTNVWQGDNIQLAFLMPGQPGTWEIGLSRIASGNPEVCVWTNPLKKHNVEQSIKLTTTREKDITAYTAIIPLKTLGVSRRTLKSGFRFNMLVNDNDGGGRKGWMQIAPGIGAKKDSSEFPVVVFE